MKKEVIDIEVKVDDAINDIKKLNKSVNNLGDTVSENNKDTAKGLKDVEKASKSTEKGVKGIGKSIKGIGTAMKAAGIGLIIAAFSTLTEIFTSNQKVADALSTVFETISLVFNEFANVVVDLYESVAKSSEKFDALGKVMSGLLTLSVTPLKLAFYGIKLAVQEAQLAWEKSFFGGKDKDKIAELNIGILETKTALFEAGEKAIQAGKDIGDNFVEAVSEIGSITGEVIEGVSKISISAAYESAKSIVQLKKSAEIAAEVQAGLIEKNDRLAEKQRQIRDNDLKSIEERKKANDELLEILNQQEIDMTKQAKLQTAAAQVDYNKNQSTENYIALLAAQNNELGIKAQIEGFLSEQDINRIGLIKEETELTNTKLESESKLSIEKKRFNAEQIEDRLANLEANKEVDILEQEQETIRLQALVDNLAAGTQAKVDAQIALDEFNEQSRQTNITRDKEIADEEIALDKKRVSEKQKALSDIISIVGAETAIGKAALIAKQILLAKELFLEIQKTITFSTQAAARSVVAVAEGTAQTAKIGFPQNIPMLIGYAAQAAGIIGAIKSAVKSSKASGISLPSTPSISTSSISQPTTPQAQTPQFNVVGSSGTNQLASAIGGQTQQPVQAYVVSNEVTTAQSLDRNIVESASFG